MDCAEIGREEEVFNLVDPLQIGEMNSTEPFHISISDDHHYSNYFCDGSCHKLQISLKNEIKSLTNQKNLLKRKYTNLLKKYNDLMTGNPESKSAKTACHKLVRNNLLLSGYYTNAQISVFQRYHKVKNIKSKSWSHEDYRKALQTRQFGNRALLHVRQKLHLPMPASPTLNLKFAFMHSFPGIIKSVMLYLKDLIPRIQV